MEAHELSAIPVTRRTVETEPAESEQNLHSSHEPASETEGGALAWLTVAAASCVFFVSLGLIYSFGIMQDELIQRGFASASVLGWVSSVTVVQMPLLAIPCTKLVSWLGNQRAGLLGALLISAGYFATSWCFDSLALLFVAQSVFGAGYAVVFWSSSQIAASYFVRKRALATGIVYSASGLGGAAFSLSLRRLTFQVGLEWAVRIFGIIAFVLLVPASFALIPNKYRRTKSQAAIRLSLFRDARFNLLLLATGLATFPLLVPPFFLPTYATSAGLSKSTGAWLVAAYNLASAVGRLAFGVLADSRIGPVTALFLALVLSSLSILAIWTVSDSLATLAIAMILNGSSSGALLSLQAPVNAAIFGLQDIALTLVRICRIYAYTFQQFSILTVLTQSSLC